MSERDTDLGRIHEILFHIEETGDTLINALFPRIPDASPYEARYWGNSEKGEDLLTYSELGKVGKHFTHFIHKAGSVCALSYDDMYDEAYSDKGRLNLAYQILTKAPSLSAVGSEAFITYLMNACRLLSKEEGAGIIKRGSFFTYQTPTLPVLTLMPLSEALENEETYFYGDPKYTGPRDIHYVHLLEQVMRLYSKYMLSPQEEQSIMALLHILLEMVDYNRRYTASVSAKYLCAFVYAIKARLKEPGCARQVWSTALRDIGDVLPEDYMAAPYVIAQGSLQGERLRGLIYSYV